VISHAKTTQEKGKTIFHIEYGFRNCLTDSVGENGKNNYEDVMLVQKRLRELGYPGKDEVGKCGPEIIKAIKFFQVFNCALKMDYYKFDGRIDPKGKTEKLLFSKQPEKYKEIEKTGEKGIKATVQESIKNAKSGTDETIKGYWIKIENVWKEVGPYLPVGSELTSGGHKEGALPGKSLHQKGRAIDVGGTSGRLERIRALAYYLIKFENTAFVSAVNNETNCVHFEFD
jgi:hypothetical protein